MRRIHLAVQAAIVLTMVSLVSWPQFRPTGRTQSVWRYAPAAVLEAHASDAARFAGNPALMQRPRPNTSQTELAAPVSAPGPLPAAARPEYHASAAVAAAGGKLNALLGFARTSLNAPIPYAKVVLRNLRTGRTLATTVANEQGQFSFLDVEANAYIVELIGPDGAVVAASPMVSLSRGDVRMTEVRAAAEARTVTASFSNAMSSTLPQMTAAAASNDVTRTTSTTTPQESSR